MGKHTRISKQRKQSTLVNHTINYELQTTAKIANVLTGNQTENKIRQGIEQAAQTGKQKLESN
ncbi:MAG: hypothetical protein M3Z01_02090 [Thermoproteota archaeon]|nr:hypothetical protein [Thermoproteota archaeon]